MPAAKLRAFSFNRDSRPVTPHGFFFAVESLSAFFSSCFWPCGARLLRMALTPDFDVGACVSLWFGLELSGPLPFP